MAIDTETTIDQYQNLMFGSCGIWINNNLKWLILFYDESLTNEQIAIIEKYAKDEGYICIPRTKFVEKWFYPYAYDARARVIMFNAPFDISRLAIKATRSRKYKDGFSFALSDNPYIRISWLKALIARGHS